MLTLIYNQGHADEESFEIQAEALTIGRADEHAISIPHRSLSRAHARIEPVDGRVFVVDLDSKNGTFVNGAAIKRQEVRAGDRITFGDLVFTLTRSDGGSPEAPLAPALDADRAAARRDGESPAPRPSAVRTLAEPAMATFLGGARPDDGESRDRRASDRLQILLQVSRLLSVPAGIDEVLHKILDLAVQILGADRGVILLVNPETRRLEPRVVKSAPGGGGGPIHSQKIVEYIAAEGVAALFSNAWEDPRLVEAESIIFQSIRSSMGAPLRPRNEIIGVLYIDNTTSPSAFSEADLEFLAAFASHAGAALESSMLYRRIEAETRTRTQLIMEAKLASLGAMVAGIAHELRNPLNFVTNFAELSNGLVQDLSTSLGTQRRHLDPEVLVDIDEAVAFLRDNMAKIDEHARRADAVIHGMLLHARGGGGGRETVDFNALVAEAVGLARAGGRNAGFEVALDAVYDEALGRVETASTDLSRALLNVLDNALYAMRKKSREPGRDYAPVLTIRTAGLPDGVEVRIRDNGPGIPAEIAELIYNPFFTTRPPGEGTGLGLSLSHDIVVEGHGGTIRMETSPGEHTEFVISLPRKAASAPSE